jgi:hypothetical protein
VGIEVYVEKYLRTKDVSAFMSIFERKKILLKIFRLERHFHVPFENQN